MRDNAPSLICDLVLMWFQGNIVHNACFSDAGMFYYTLGNLRPELRSTHSAIQLISCVTAPILKKYGFRQILKPFIEDVKVLHDVRLYIPANTYTVEALYKGHLGTSNFCP